MRCKVELAENSGWCELDRIGEPTVYGTCRLKFCTGVARAYKEPLPHFLWIFNFPSIKIPTPESLEALGKTVRRRALCRPPAELPFIYPKLNTKLRANWAAQNSKTLIIYILSHSPAFLSPQPLRSSSIDKIAELCFLSPPAPLCLSLNPREHLPLLVEL